MDSCRDIIVSLLQNLGTRREIEQYLKAFTGVDAARFAVIKVGGGLLIDQFELLVSSLAFLRHVGLRPVVVHGAGPQLTEELEREGVSCEWIGGNRVTTPQVLTAARRVFQRECARLADALESREVRARPLCSGVFEASRVQNSSLGLVGEVRSVDLTLVRQAIEAGQIPIISPLGETRGGQVLNINADAAARALTLALKPRKIVFLTPTGGLLDANGRVIPAVNLAEDYERFLSGSWIRGGMALKLREIKRLIDELPTASSVSVTSPEHLARELFTHRGDGTLIRRGVYIHERPGVRGVDLERLSELIEASFGRALTPDYFDTRRIERVLMADDYSAAAVLTGDGPAPYLDKFAVTPEAQGAGVGASLWNRVAASAPTLFWRARRDHRANPWYFERADGASRGGEWVVFWRGMREAEAIRDCVEYALALAPSLVEPAQADKETALAG